MKAKIILISVAILLFFARCEEKDDFSNFSRDYPYKGEFAFTLGNSTLSLSNYNFLPPGWEKLIGYIQLPDSLAPFNQKIPFLMKSYITDTEFISKANFTVVTNNNFPVGAKINILLADRFVKPIDAINHTIEIKAVENPGDSIVQIDNIIVSKEQFLKWDNVSYMIFNCTLDSGLDSVFFANYKTYRLKIDIGLRVSLDFNLKDVDQWQTK